MNTILPSIINRCKNVPINKKELKMVVLIGFCSLLNTLLVIQFEGPDKYDDYNLLFRIYIKILVYDFYIIESFFCRTETDVIFKLNWIRIPFLFAHILVFCGRHLYPELNHPKIFLLPIIIYLIIESL